jgi:hypothetical protein
MPSETFAVAASIVLPFIGSEPIASKTLTLSGLEDTAADIVVGAAGKATGTAKVTQSTADPTEFALAVEVEVDGKEEPFAFDFHLTGITEEGAAELIKLDGGDVEVDVSVTKQAAA